MSNYGITGWSGGVRQSLTHNLRAGQMRGMGRVNVFPNTTIINNNFGGGYGFYDDSCCCSSNNNSTPSWMNWMMGIGLGTSLLGNILGMFGIGGGGGSSKTEGAGEAKTEAPKQDTNENKKLDEFEGLKVLYPDGKFAKVGDKYCCRIGDKVIEADSLVDLNKALKEALEGAKAKHEVKDTKEEKEEKESLKDVGFTVIKDMKLGEKANISGTVSTNDDGTYTMTTNNNVFTYKETGKTAKYNGKEYPIYTCTGVKDAKTGKTKAMNAQDYILVNGELIQPNDPKLGLRGLGTGTIKH